MQDLNSTTTKKLRSIVLKNSIEIMGELNEEAISTTSIALKKVFQVSKLPQADSPEPQIVLTAYMVHTNLHENIAVRLDDIMFVGIPEPRIGEYYTKLTSNIIQPTKPSIILN